MIAIKTLVLGWDKIKKHPYVFLSIITGIIFLFSYERYIWGNDYFIFTDAGSDCYDEYYPLYVYIVNKIKNGELSLWNNSWGLGCDTLVRQEWLLDPFAIVTISVGLLGGEQAIAESLIVTQLLKIILSSLLAYKYLCYFELIDDARIISALIYGFNSFLIVWGQHYWFGAAGIYTVVLLVVLEEWLKDIGRPKKYILLYSLVVALYFIYSVYFAYMAIIVTSIYACLRYIYLYEKGVFINGLRIVCAVVLGIVLAGVMILPFVDNTVGVSSRISTDSIWIRCLEYLTNPYELQYYIKTLIRMISSNVIGINSLGGAYYGLPLLSISVVGLPFLEEGALYIWAKMKGKREKRIFISSLVLVLFLVFVPLGSCILNALQYPFGRYTFVILPVATVIFAFGLHKVIAEKKMNYIITGIIIIGVCGLLLCSAFLFENTEFIRGFIKFVIWLNVIVYALMIVSTRCKTKMGEIAIFAVIILGVMGETYVSSSSEERKVVDDLAYERRSRTEAVLSELKRTEENWFRIDKTYSDFGFLGDMLIEGLCLPTSYNSTLNGNVSCFYEEIWPEVMTAGTTKVTTTRGILNNDCLKEDNVLTLLGVKYLLTEQEIEKVDRTWEKKELDGQDIIVYRNTNANSIVTAFDKIISEETFEKLPNEKRKEVIKSYLILSEEDILVNEIETSDIEESVLKQGEFDNEYFLELMKDTWFNGEVSINEEKYLLVTIPYRNGWNVYIDGEKVQHYKGDYGFISFSIAKGQHTLEIKYENNIYLVGLIVSLMGLACWIVLYKSQYGAEKDKKVEGYK